MQNHCSISPQQIPLFEEWKPVVEYEGWYEVSSYGRVRRVAGGKAARPGRIRNLVPRNGYLQVNLSRHNVQELKWVHRLVAESFLENPENKLQVNHIDGDRSNNHVSNLEWVTHAENCLHAYQAGLRKAAPSKGIKNGNAILTEAKVRQIRRLAKTERINDLAHRFGVSRSAISGVIRNVSWRHVK